MADEFADYDLVTTEEQVVRRRRIDHMIHDLKIRREQASALSAEIRKAEKELNDYTNRRIRERGKPHQMDFDEFLAEKRAHEGEPPRPGDPGEDQ